MILKKSIDSLIQLSDEEFARYHISADPIEGKLSPELRKEIIKKSLECGYKEADKLLNKLGKESKKLDIFKLAEDIGIRIRIKDTDNCMEYIYFGEFEEPGIITLYKDIIHKGEVLVKEYGICTLHEVNLKEIVLAHEVFHYIESKNKDLYVNTFRIDLWKLGPYIHTSGLVCTGEIAGMAFARRILNLNFCPNVLDVLLLYPQDKVQAELLYYQIMNCCYKNNA